jgi:hypothetical protein
MQTAVDLKQLRIAITGGTSGLGLALVSSPPAARRSHSSLALPGPLTKSQMKRVPAESSVMSGARRTFTRSRCR